MKLSLIIATLATVLNIILTSLVGFIVFYSIGVSDPPIDNVGDLAVIQAFAKQKQLELTIVEVLTLLFVIGFLISLIFWLRKGRPWNFILSGLAAIHLLVLLYCFNNELVFFPMFIYLSFILDLIIIVAVFFDNRVRYPLVKA
jgi:hypothetical protein